MEKRLPSFLRSLNEKSNDLLRKGFIVLCVLVGLFVFLKLFRFVAPFVMALLLSQIIEPVIRFISSNDHRFRLPRKLAALLCTVLLITLLVLLVVSISSRAYTEVKALGSRLPYMARDWAAQFNSFVDRTFLQVEQWNLFNEASIENARTYLRQFGSNLATNAGPLSATLLQGALLTAFSLPQALLFVVLMLLATYYMASDRERIIGYFHKLMPDRARYLFGEMKRGMIRALFGQLRAQVYLTLLMLVELMLGFTIMGIPYALLLGMVISVLDALPVVGSGLFLLPWGAIGLLTGNMTVGIGMLLLYGVTLVVRQLVEPRVVGAQLGVYPLATMMSMYAGFVLFGFLGMLMGPVTFLLCRVTVYAICGTPEEVQELLTPPHKHKRVTFIAKTKKK